MAMTDTLLVPNSVWELPSEMDWTPAALCDYITDRWDDADCDARCTLFDLAAGLYWYCSDWHSGQWSDEYSIMSARLGYTPGRSESSAADAGEDAQHVYDMIADACGVQHG